MSRHESRFPGTLVARGLLTFVTLAAVLALAASTASATVMKYLNLVQLVEKSDVIVHGTVADQTFFHDETRNNVMTRWSVDVKRSYLGSDTPSVSFVQWGGEDGNVVHAIPGDADLKKGEEVVLFLNEHQGTLYLTALGQSKYAVIRKGDIVDVFRDLSSVSFVEGEQPSPIHKHSEQTGFASFEAELVSVVAAVKGVER